MSVEEHTRVYSEYEEALGKFNTRNSEFIVWTCIGLTLLFSSLVVGVSPELGLDKQVEFLKDPVFDRKLGISGFVGSVVLLLQCAAYRSRYVNPARQAAIRKYNRHLEEENIDNGSPIRWS